MQKILEHVAKSSLRAEKLGEFEVGDTVNVFTRIKEGDKERTQIFNGTVISRCKGQGPINATFTVRRVVSGEGVERIFPLHSRKIEKVDVVRHGSVRRAKLFYLRNRVGKATKVKEQMIDKEAATAAPAAKA